MPWLLAAEADQIQDLIFRSSRLREVVGGSQLLSRFCREGAPALLARHDGETEDLIVNDGGAFRIRFASEDQAISFGEDLAELYRCTVGGNLTVAAPVEWQDNNENSFTEANAASQEALREAKSRGDVPAASAHLPHIAFCASCGLALSFWHGVRHEDDRPNYLCIDCMSKNLERDWGTGGSLDSLRQAVAPDLSRAERGDWAEAIGELDLTGRRYVAYLLADGNGMGRTFNRCRNSSAMTRLSDSLREIVIGSLAAPCRPLLARMREAEKNRVLPVVPLILGGDDLFALLPASWSIDLARRFCSEYERRMAQTLHELHLADASPTVAAAVVICKANYPHALAHRRGEALLQQAKRLARSLETDTDETRRRRASVVNFAVITGHDVDSDAALTVTPCFTETSGPEGLSAALFIHHRRQLARNLPGKRRAEFRSLFDETMSEEPPDRARTWDPGCKILLHRLSGLGSATETKELVRQALEDLGRPANEPGQPFYWRSFHRPEGTGFWANGFADLLEIWDYSYDVTVTLSEYEDL